MSAKNDAAPGRGENRLIALLIKEDNLTEKRLKQLFRQLSKASHPDARPGRSEQFIKLRREYEEALALLRRQSAPRPREEPAGPGVREKIMRALSLYALKEMTQEAEGLLRELIELLDLVDPPVARCFRRYHDLFYETYSSWVSDGDVYFAHGVFIALIKQFFYFKDSGKARHRTLFTAYHRDLEERSRKLDADRADALSGIVAWLEREISA